MELIRDKKDIEQRIIDEAGELTEGMELLINDNSIQLKDKVDAYGYVMEKMESDIQYLKSKKVRLNELQKVMEKKVTKIKYRLNELSSIDGELIGNEYKFKPYISKVAKEIDMDKVEPKYVTYVISLTHSAMMDVFDNIKDNERTILEDNMKKTCKVSDLPKDHPAIIYELTNTVKG